MGNASKGTEKKRSGEEAIGKEEERHISTVHILT
jgi:hypothetical protein